MPIETQIVHEAQDKGMIGEFQRVHDPNMSMGGEMQSVYFMKVIWLSRLKETDFEF